MVTLCVLSCISVGLKGLWIWLSPTHCLQNAVLRCLTGNQPAGYLYHELPTFGASNLFIKTLLRRSIDAWLTIEAPLCTYDPATHVLTTPCDLTQEGVLSDVWSLPFFQDVLANKMAVNTSKKSKKTYISPKMCFQLGSARSKLCMARMPGSITMSLSQL